jgi:hypothetical protein
MIGTLGAESKGAYSFVHRIMHLWSQLPAEAVRTLLLYMLHGYLFGYMKYIFVFTQVDCDRLCGLVDRVPGYRSRGPGSIPVSTRFSEE